ncbi:PREDICTED: protein PET117 homolog, mitochondrial [Rhagoletis zephyria]|uniref:protein PET117 homolog, mitochondrial n=1 Tax=Rhagoletis zephyria TaxID=28612 RepID=UPI000811468D|nr:PREDICTED: protein PET117 homolog, mitochondrial [Rhagoletis zephyria]
MSAGAKIALALSIGFSASVIGYVHYKQSTDRARLHEGVVRDIERQQRRKTENTYLLQKQIDLTKQLKDIEASNQNPEFNKNSNIH